MGIGAFVAAMVLAFVMGFGINRGGTCTVAAIDELLMAKRANRLLALTEAAIFVLGCVLIARAVGFAPPLSQGYSVSLWTVAGALLLGLGATINRACVLGTVAHFGSGQWVYIATPLGFYLSNLMGATFLPHFSPRPLHEAPWVTDAPPGLAGLIGIWMVWRSARLAYKSVVISRDRKQQLPPAMWEPHAATLVIAITFFFLLWIAGSWTYTDALAEWARGSVQASSERIALFLALLLGASYGGWTTGRWRIQRLTLSSFVRKFLGGSLMGAGSMLTPGGNDGLILAGMPLLWAYAWLSFAAMCLAIAGALLAMQKGST